MITPFARLMGTTKATSGQLVDSLFLPSSGEVHPFPKVVLVLLLVPVILHCRFAGKISRLSTRWECSSGSYGSFERPLLKFLPPTRVTQSHFFGGTHGGTEGRYSGGFG